MTVIATGAVVSQDISPSLLENFRTYREALTAEAQKLGKGYADICTEAFYKLKSSPVYKQSNISLNEATLLRATISFWEDILRIKAYHPVDIAEEFKKAAYIFKWISKMKPVKPGLDSVRDLRSEDLDANAYFALLCALGHLECDCRKVFVELKKLVYFSTYRDVNPDDWTLIFEYLARLYPKDASASAAQK